MHNEKRRQMDHNPANIGPMVPEMKYWQNNAADCKLMVSICIPNIQNIICGTIVLIIHDLFASPYLWIGFYNK